MADQPAKKVRSEKQLAANEASRKAGQEAMRFLEERELKKSVINAAYYRQQKKAGKSNSEIADEIRARQNARAGTKKNNKPKAASNGAAGPAAAAAANNGTRKIRSAKQVAADQALRNLKKTFNAQGVKWVGPSLKEYKAEKAKGRNNNSIFANLKGKFPAMTVNETGAAKPVVYKRAASKKPNVAPVPGPVAVNAPKGSYVCERCRLVTNSATRKNNAAPRNNTSGANFNAPGFWYGE